MGVKGRILLGTRWTVTAGPVAVVVVGMCAADDWWHACMHVWAAQPYKVLACRFGLVRGR
jgi:hypothetical protein